MGLWAVGGEGTKGARLSLVGCHWHMNNSPPKYFSYFSREWLVNSSMFVNIFLLENFPNTKPEQYWHCVLEHHPG